MEFQIEKNRNFLKLGFMNLMGFISIIIVVVAMIIVIAAAVIFLMNDNAKEKAVAEETNKPVTPDKMNEKDKEAYKKEKQKTKWSDPNEHAKYVITGGKVECPFCSPSFADIIVTSTTVKLQDKQWATVEDNDGKKNFNFAGICKHPSHGSNKPPCKAVISLGSWKNFSETLIDGKNALVVQSTILCEISGQDLKITDSGQKANLTKIEPERKRIPYITDVYWKEEGCDDKMYIEYPDYPVTLYIETKDYKQDEFVKLQITNGDDKLFEGNNKEYFVTAKVSSEGIAVVKNFKIIYEKNAIL